MRITGKLAYNQLKRNRSRTIWTLIAIALSTSLTTAVCSFVASGQTMLVNFLGSDYGMYGSSYIALLLIPAIILGIIIAAMSVTVVSNVFRISAQERVAQFGVLKCVGATKKQITDTVVYESILLSIIGIPFGILLGLLLAFAGIQVVSASMDELNSLAHMMINKIDLSIDFVISWKALVVSAVVCFLTVLFSAWLPAHKAARISAIDCIRGAGGVKINRKEVRISRLVEKFFGFEGTLAARNLKRSRRNFRATVISLAVGVILFVSLGALGNQANAIMEYMYPDNNQTVISEYSSARTWSVNEATGKREADILNPMDSEMGDVIAARLEGFEGVEIFGIGEDSETYNAILPAELVSGDLLDLLSDEEKQEYAVEAQQSYEFPVEIIAIDQDNYSKLCEKAGVPEGSNILLNHYSCNDFGKLANVEPISPEINNIELIKGDNSTSEIEIQGILTQEDGLPEELFYPRMSPVRLIVPQAEVRFYSWYSAPSDIEGFIDYSNSVLGEFFPSDEDSSYMETGFNTRTYKISDYVKVMNIAIVLATVFMYSFVILLMLIGLTNVISTISTNVMMRSREFAVLKSVGMTPESLKRMLNFESILCSAKAILYGLPIGVVITVLINLPIRSMFPIPYKIPWLAIVLCILAVLLITWSTTRYAAHRLKNQNIIETIRSESGR